MKRIAFLFVLGLAGAAVVWGQDWANFTTISNTLGVNANRICVGEGIRATDIGCPTYAPSVSPAGLLTATNVSVTGGVSVTGNVSANKFIGDGTGLTGVVAASGDRITSGTTQVLAISDTGYISLTTNGVTTGYFSPAGVLVANGISVSTNRMSATTGYFSGKVGIGNAGANIPLVVGDTSSFITTEGTVASFYTGNDTTLSIVSNANNSGYGPRLRLLENNHHKFGTELFYDSGSNAFSIVGYSNNIERGRIHMLINGNVGIGTDSPSAKLHVGGEGTVSASIYHASSGTEALPAYAFSQDPDSGFYNYNPNALGLTLGGSSRVRFNSNGRIDLMADDGSGLEVNRKDTDTMIARLRRNGAGGELQLRENASTKALVSAVAESYVNNGRNFGFGTSLPSATLHVAGTISATDAIQLGSSSLSCTAGIPGALRYNSGAVEVCNGSSWSPVSSEADRLVSGTLAVIANSATSIVSLSTNGTDWGYLRPSGNSYLPRLGTSFVSSTLISTTYMQLSSATEILECNTGFTGAMRYVSGTMQVCDGNNWGNIGIGVPGGTIAAFQAATCPAGWSEYTAARGRFLRGLDNGAGRDPDWPRAAGSAQGDDLKSHLHTVDPPNTATSTDGAHSHTYWAPSGSGETWSESGNSRRRNTNASTGGGGNHNHTVDISQFNSGNTGGSETRPKNVAVIFCSFNGFESQLETGVATLASLSDVSVGGATTGQVLTYDGGSWVASDTASTVNAMDDLSDVDTSGVTAGSYLRYDGSNWVVSSTYDLVMPDADRITSGSLAVIANSETSYVSLSTAGTVWGYLSSALSYLPELVASRVSATEISSTYLQVTSASTVLSCEAGLAGTLRYTSGTIQVCDGTDWSELSGRALLPAGGIVAFNLPSCPAGWNQVTALAGRTIIGVGTLVSDTYALGAIGGSSKVALTTANLPSHSHLVNPPSTASSSGGAHTHSVDPPNTATSTNGNHSHSYIRYNTRVTRAGGGGGNIWNGNRSVSTGGAGNHAHTVNIAAFNSGSAGAHTHNVDIAEFNSGSVGSGTAHENRMPYKAYIYCQSTGEEGEGGEGGGGVSATTLAGLEDVDLTDVDDGDMLIYDSGLWVVGIPTANPADGDKGDISVADGGTTWTINAGAVGQNKLANAAVTFAKLQHVTGPVLVGRSASDTGVIEEIALGEGLVLMDGVLDVSGSSSGAAALVDLSDVDVSAADDGYVLTYVSDTGLWEAQAAAGDGGALSTLSDVDVSAADEGYTLVYVSETGTWEAQATSAAEGDRITSGTLAIITNSETSYVSLTTDETTWGYFSSGASYLPHLTVGGDIVGGKVSSTHISATYIQVSSASTVTSCSTGGEGTMRYTSGTMQVCDGSGWTNIGIGVPTGTIAAFARSSCPSGWSEYTPARGRFLRGIDNGAGNDPDGTRAPGATQADEFKAHTHYNDGGNDNAVYRYWSATSRGGWRELGGDETRPKNVAVTFCQYAGYDSEIMTGTATLSSLSDVNVVGAISGQALMFDGSSWIPSTTSSLSAGGNDTEVQFNDGGSTLGGDSAFTFDKDLDLLSVGGTISSTGVVVAGNILYSGELSDLSDRRLKTGIVPLGAGSLSNLLKLQPVSFRMKGEGKPLELGFIAQDVEKVFPELVSTAADQQGIKSLNYTGLIAPIVKAIQELRKWVLALVSDLRSDDEKLRREMERKLAELDAAIVELRRELRAANDNINALWMRLEAGNDNDDRVSSSVDLRSRQLQGLTKAE